MPRSALVCDVEFYEEYPSRVQRRHSTGATAGFAGDWQITQWLLPQRSGRRTHGALPTRISVAVPVEDF